jgi:hypothetical protein
MAAAYQNLYLEQGSTYSITIVLDDVYGSNYNLAGFSASSSVRKSYYSANSSFSFNTAIDLPTSSLTLSIPANTSSNIAAGRYVYDTILRDGANNVVRVLEGTVQVSPSVTR